MFHSGLFGKAVPADHGEHLALIQSQLSRPDYWEVFRTMSRPSHAAAEAALEHVTAPTLVVMGSADKDFKDPAADAAGVADSLGGRAAMIDGAGHYPQGEQPEAMLEVLLPFLAEVTGAARRGGTP